MFANVRVRLKCSRQKGEGPDWAVGTFNLRNRAPEGVVVGAPPNNRQRPIRFPDVGYCHIAKSKAAIEVTPMASRASMSATSTIGLFPLWLFAPFSF